MNAIDTNVLVYAHDSRDPQKQAVAISLIESLSNPVLLWQVACEYISVSRKLEPLGYSRQQAWQDVRDLRSVWAAALPSWDMLDRAEKIMNRHSLAFWDAMIVAACLEIGVQRLYSEDFSGLKISGIKIINPFSKSPTT
ncbi:MAG: PIN domain-containing protein [Thermoguttaceae bacterium]